MNAIKTLLAVSVLAAAGVANAATVATFDYSDTWTTYKQLLNGTPSTATYGTGSLIGTGTLDDTGLLTITATGQFTPTGSATSQYTADETLTFTGSVSGSIDNLSTYAINVNSCTPGAGFATGCTGVASAAAVAFAGAVSTTDGAVTTWTTPKTKVGTNPAWNQDTYTFTAHAVPVPAAAWLFGSGLLGLAGTARRRFSA